MGLPDALEAAEWAIGRYVQLAAGNALDEIGSGSSHDSISLGTGFEAMVGRWGCLRLEFGGPQRLKPISLLMPLSARLKSCPDTGRLLCGRRRCSLRATITGKYQRSFEAAV